MSFDARSLERLQQLGRTLPQPLPKPVAKPEPPAGDVPAAQQARHRVETETDPQALFRELIQASPDGTVPPHLLDRLRALEAARRPAPLSPDAGIPAPSSPATPTSNRNPNRNSNRNRGRLDPRLAAEHGELYTAFQQLLLEDDESS